jgi:threonine dehydratase
MPQRPRALKEFLNLLGPNDDITRFEYLKKSARNFGSLLIGLKTKSADQFESFFSRLDASEFTYSDITNDEVMAQFVV